MNSMTLNFDVPLSDASKSFLQSLLGSAAPVGGAGGPVPVDNFPADPGMAPFPSPENSHQTVLNGKISGPPYLMSKGAAEWTLLPDQPITNEYGSGYAVSVNGQVQAGAAFTQLIVRQGIVYFTFNGGNVGVFEQPDGINTGIFRTSLPPALTSSGTGADGGTVALPAMPPAPAAFTAWTGKVILFGDNQPCKDMQSAHDAAQPGDTIQAGPEMVARSFPMTLGTTKPIIVDLGGRVTGAGAETPTWQPGLTLNLSGLDASTFPHQLGAIVPTADCIVRGASITGAGMVQAGHDGTAAIRAGAAINLTVDHCWLSKNQNGIGPSGFDGTLTVTNTVEVDNYLPNDPSPGGSHNVYALGVSATFGPGFTSVVHQTSTEAGGHAVKSRARITTLVEPFYIYSGDSSSLDIPDGSTAVCNVGAGTIAKKAGDANHTVIGYGVESQLNGLAGVACKGTKLDLECDSPLIGTTGPITFDAACTFTGNKPSAPQGSAVTGIPT